MGQVLGIKLFQTDSTRARLLTSNCQIAVVFDMSSVCVCMVSHLSEIEILEYVK